MALVSVPLPVVTFEVDVVVREVSVTPAHREGTYNSDPWVPARTETAQVASLTLRADTLDALREKVTAALAAAL